jgi:hypothetical protein
VQILIIDGNFLKHMKKLRLIQSNEFIINFKGQILLNKRFLFLKKTKHYRFLSS